MTKQKVFILKINYIKTETIIKEYTFFNKYQAEKLQAYFNNLIDTNEKYENFEVWIETKDIIVREAC